MCVCVFGVAELGGYGLTGGIRHHSSDWVFNYFLSSFSVVSQTNRSPFFLFVSTLLIYNCDSFNWVSEFLIVYT